MSDDIKVTRLSKAAREFNVGISTIVEFLHKKGFNLDSNPNTKIPPEAYALLVKEYSKDLNAKKESEKLLLKELHRKKETVTLDDISTKPQSEEMEAANEILIKDVTGVTKVEIKPEPPKQAVKIVGKIDLGKPPKKSAPVTEESPEKEKPAAEEKKPAKKTKETKEEVAAEQPGKKDKETETPSEQAEAVSAEQGKKITTETDTATLISEKKEKEIEPQKVKSTEETPVA
ncbi:MAG: hypothetical protein GYA43_08080, partial [Bacteroidales bacterium]|nr:hypothetical protein [Bacteroidales bacterium]